MALILAPVLGTIFSILCSVGVNAAVGRAVTGGVNLSAANVIVMLLTGFYTGFMAALFAGRRGLLVAAAANWLPLTVLLTISMILNRDLVTAPSGASLGIWPWISFLPSLLGGYFGASRTPRESPPRMKRKRSAEKIADVFD
ncbi:MAG: hypothetical protein ACREEB_06760 [Caulobacteraceae bacterium]